MYQFLYHTLTLTPAQQVDILGKQPAPLPMLTILDPTNTQVILHSIGTFYPNLGLSPGNHPSAGTMLALLGDAMSIGKALPVVTIPLLAFSNKQNWPTATLTLVAVMANNHTDMLQPDMNNDAHVSHLIPLPPHLVCFFTANANIPLPQLAKAFLTFHANAKPNLNGTIPLHCSHGGRCSTGKPTMQSTCSTTLHGAGGQ